MDNIRTLGIVPVSVTLQVVLAVERLEAMLNESEKNIGRTLAERIDTIVRSEKHGYYPALDYFEGHAGLAPELLTLVKSLAAQIRKRVKRDVQTHLWPVFSSVQIERATTLARDMVTLIARLDAYLATQPEDSGDDATAKPT